MKNTVSSRAVDRLVDPGRNLPPGAPEPRFTDVTNAAGLASFRQFQGARTSQLPEDMGSGVAWGDFDNDGLDDLFVVSGGGPLGVPARNSRRLCSIAIWAMAVSRRCRTFRTSAFIGMGAAWGDYNNDGWLDLVVTGYDTIILFRNDHGHLVRDKSFPSPKGFWTGVSWGDYNRDGYLDLYVCGYVKYKPGERDASANSTQFGLEVPFTLNPASYEPERNLLFRNNGNGTFTEVAQELGVANPEGRSLSALWHDFDGDGWPDLYVANDISENKLYLNHHGTFVDAGRSAWVEEYRGSMGLAAGDFDRDGDDDLLFRTGSRRGSRSINHCSLSRKEWPTGRSCTSPTWRQTWASVSPRCRRSDGARASSISTRMAGLISWSPTGALSNKRKRPPPRLAPMASFLFWNDHGSFFYDLAPWNRSFSQPHVSRGLAVADFNNDGAMDIAIVDQGRRCAAVAERHPARQLGRVQAAQPGSPTGARWDSATVQP